jgi:DNA-directed RNA polymerase sigma subunit (sigma70/sigma32)
MLFTNISDFYLEAKSLRRLPREEEKQCARQMAADPMAREQLVRSYYPQVAGYLRRAPSELQTLKTLYACLTTLEKGVDSFNFQQDSEPFSHHLAWRLRQSITRCIAER